MVEDSGKQEEEKFDFTREGESLGYISLDQARVMAMRTANETPGAYGPAYQDVPMAFEVVEAEETEDHYVISITFRPQGEFADAPGRQQFFIEKEGVIALRQVLTLPRRQRRFPVVPAVVGVAVVGVIAGIAVFAVGGFDGSGDGEESDPSAPIAVSAPTPALPIAPAAEATATPTPTAAPFPAPTAVPLATPTPIVQAVVKEVAVTATPAPTPVPTPTPRPAAPEISTVPRGSLNVAFQELGSYQGHPGQTRFPQYNYVGLAAYESLVGRDVNGDYFGKLAESWSVAPDELTWTFELRKSIPFHGGWGEVTAEDVIWSISLAGGEDSLSPRRDQIRNAFLNPAGHFTVLDDYLIQVNTGIPQWDVLRWLTTPGLAGTWVVSKMQATQLFESIWVDAANSQLVGTGPWEMLETETGQFWKFKAVADHYRKAPEFAEMTFYEILEESTRIANFQVGQIDVFSATPDQLAVMNDQPGTKLMAQANSNQFHLGLYGSWYENVGTSGQRPGYNPGLSWVSSNPDTRSPEWSVARKVRLAMGEAIDREAIVEGLLRGEGAPLSMWGWAGHGDWELPEWQWEYDVGRARELLAEAGYPDGFELELTPVMRGVGAEVAGCEAVAAMWREIGIKTNITIFPYSTLRPDMISRTLNSITCHATAAFAEPVVLWDLIYDPEGAWSSGLDHPFLTNALDITRDTFDTTRRWQTQQEVGFWIWENVLDIGLYSQNNLYLLGPKLDSWAEHLERGNTRLISALEWAPHRR